MENHNEEYICLFCVDPNCDLESRALCSRCVREKRYNHKDCRDLLGFKDFKKFELKFLYLPKHDIY